MKVAYIQNLSDKADIEAAHDKANERKDKI